MTILHEIDVPQGPTTPACRYRLLDVGESELLVQVHVRCAGKQMPTSLIIADVTRDRGSPLVRFYRPLGVGGVEHVTRLVRGYLDLSPSQRPNVPPSLHLEGGPDAAG